MATLTKVNVSLTTLNPPQTNRVGSGLICGEDLAAGDVCYIKSDGLVWRSNGTAATAPAKARGMTMLRCRVAQNDAVTLYVDVDVNYSTGLTPGADYYVSATPGALDDAATTGGTAPVAYAIDATRIRFLGSRY